MGSLEALLIQIPYFGIIFGPVRKSEKIVARTFGGGDEEDPKNRKKLIMLDYCLIILDIKNIISEISLVISFQFI